MVAPVSIRVPLPESRPFLPELGVWLQVLVSRLVVQELLPSLLRDRSFLLELVEYTPRTMPISSGMIRTIDWESGRPVRPPCSLSMVRATLSASRMTAAITTRYRRRVRENSWFLVRILLNPRFL
jgi:hypothetical protein